MKLEKDTEEPFCKYARAKGCYPVKFSDPARRGAPDRMVMCPGARMFFVEFKRPGKKPKDEQRAYAVGLGLLGFQSIWSAKEGEAEAFLDKFLDL